MIITIERIDKTWIASSDLPDLCVQGDTELEALEKFVETYKIFTDRELQIELFGY